MLYPIFVHTYLELLALGAGSAAQEMLSHSRARFLSGTAVSSNSGKGRVAELNELSSLSTPQHLDTSSLARSVRAKRAPVRLSQYAYDLALQYLRQHDLALVLGMINRWLAVEVTESSGAAGVVEGGSLLSMLGGSMDSAAVNQAPIDTKLLKDSAMHQHSVRKAEQAEREAAEKTQDESLTKKQLAELQKLAEEARKQLDAAKANCIEPQIPLPPVAQEHTDALLQDLDVCETAGAGGKPLGPDALPSAAMFTFVNTKQTMNCVAVSSEADCIAAGFADASVRLYRLKGDPAMTTFTGHTGPVYGADFSPDDQLLLSSGADGTVRLWSMELSTGLVAFTGHMLPVWDVAFAPDQGYYFASASADRTARLWCTERSQALRVLAGHQGDVDVVRWHPNCQYVATGSSDHTVRLWDLRDGSCVRLLEGHNKAVSYTTVCGLACDIGNCNLVQEGYNHHLQLSCPPSIARRSLPCLSLQTAPVWQRLMKQAC